MTFDTDLFSSYTKFDEPKSVRVGNDAIIKACGYGSIKLK